MPRMGRMKAKAKASQGCTGPDFSEAWRGGAEEGLAWPASPRGLE